MASGKVGIVEDHGLIALGLMGLLRDAGVESVRAATVDDLLGQAQALALAVLDLRLADGSSVTGNITRLQEAGLPVLILTSGENPALLREAARADVLGIVPKSLPESEILSAVLQALAGSPVPSLEWAAALDADPRLADAGLSPREREILALYASGETAKTVARLTGLTPATVANYISRIRAKYAQAGRQAASRVDLYHRALEDRLIGDGA